MSRKHGQIPLGLGGFFYAYPYTYGDRGETFEKYSQIMDNMYNKSFPDPEINMVIYTNDCKRWPSSVFEKLENPSLIFIITVNSELT